MRRYHLFIMCFLMVLQAFSQSKLDRLEEAITKKDYKVSDALATDLIGSEVSLERAFGFWALGVARLSDNPDSANFLLRQALDQRPDDVLKLKILNAQANYYDITGSTKKSIAVLLDVEDLAKTHDPTFLAGIYNNLSIAYRSLDLFDSAVYYGFEGLKFAERKNQSFEQKRLYNSIAIAFAVQGDLLKAQTYFAQSLNLALSNNDSTGASKGYVNLTQLKIYQGNLDSARVYLQLAEVYNARNRNALDIMDMYALFAEVKSSKEEYETALAFLEDALESLEGLDYPLEKANLYLQKVKASLKLEEIRNAKLSLDSAKFWIEKSDSKTYMLEAAKLQKKIYVMGGRLREALEIDGEIDSLTSAIFNASKTKAVEEIRAKYETEKKEQQIVNLEQEAEIAQLRIQQQNLMLIGAIFLLVVLSIIGFSIYRNRTLRLAQQRLLVEQKLLRSQMNPHFLFNALASIHSFIFKGDKREASDYLATFSELTRDILDDSSRDWVTLEKELTTLSKYIDVQKLRFPGISSHIEVDDTIETDNLLFPPLLLQPFVENSFEHGLKDKKEGAIKIRVSDTTMVLKVEIEDDGAGFTSSASAHESKAIKIARQRLAILYGKEKAMLSVSIRPDQPGVLVTIVVPKNEVV